VFLLECGTVLTVWFCFFGVWNCSHSLVLFYWNVELFSRPKKTISDCENSSTLQYKQYQTVRTDPHSNTNNFYWSVELFLQSGIALLECGAVLTVWYCFYWIVELFSQSVIVFIGVWNCSHSMVLSSTIQ
jgi:hypothetical protein